MVSWAGHYVNMKTSILMPLVVALCFDYSYSEEEQSNALGSGSSPPPDIAAPTGPYPCVCGVFLSGQFTKGSSEQPRGHAALLHEHQESFACNVFGNKQCTNKCLDVIVKHLPNSPTILCGSIDRDCHKERAYLFIKNCNDTWINTNLSAGREYCCKDGLPYKCPLI